MNFGGVLGWFEVGPIARGMHPNWRGKGSKSNGVMACHKVSQVLWQDSTCARVGADTQCQDQPWEHPEGYPAGHKETLQDTTPRPRGLQPHQGWGQGHRGRDRDTQDRTGTHRAVTGSHGGG